MTTNQIVPGVYAIPIGNVNAFLIDEDGLTLIDTYTWEYREDSSKGTRTWQAAHRYQAYFSDALPL